MVWMIAKCNCLEVDVECHLCFLFLQRGSSWSIKIGVSIDFCRCMLILYVMFYVVAMSDVGCLFIQLSELLSSMFDVLPQFTCFIGCEVLNMLFEDGTTWIQMFFLWMHLLLELVPTM